MLEAYRVPGGKGDRPALICMKVISRLERIDLGVIAMTSRWHV
jgi:hypothetical protein